MKKGFILMAIAILFLPFAALAAEFKTGETTATVASNEKVGNLYVGSQTINIDGVVTKDLIAGGSTININGTVENTIIAAGNTLNVKGNVGNNIRFLGSDMVIRGLVGGDVTAAGGTVTVDKDAVVSGDVMFAGGTLVIDGAVNGNVYASGAKIVVNGTVKGEIKANIGNVTLGDNAVVVGPLNYWSQNQAKIANENNVKGGVSYHKQEKNNFSFSGFWYFTLIAKTIGLMILLLILVFTMPRFARNFATETYKNLWKNLAWGVFSLFVIPIIAVLLIITLIGIPLAGILGLAYLLMLITAGILTPLAIGTLVWKVIKRADKYEASWKVALIGTLSAFILQIVPVIGWLALFVFFLFSLGEVSLTVWGVLRKQKA